MASWAPYKNLDVPDSSTGPAGINLTADLKLLANRAPFCAASNPTANDDSNEDPSTKNIFLKGSLWFNTASQTMWVCVDDTPTTAKWRSVWRRVEKALVLAPVGPVTGSDSRALQFDHAETDNARGANAVDLQRIRSAITQVARGDQSAIIGGENNTAFSNDSVVAGGMGNNAGGGSGTIAGISIHNPTEVTTSSNHGLVTGQNISITGSDSDPSIDGDWIVTVTGPNTFTVGVDVTDAVGTTGSWTTSSTAAYAFVGGGSNNKALGQASHAEGQSTKAVGPASHSEGFGSLARGAGTHAEGVYTLADGDSTHVEGGNTTANGFCCHSEGYNTVSFGRGSHAEGQSTTASWYAHAEGSGSAAAGYMSHAEGFGTQAYGSASHSGGILSRANLPAQWARASGGIDGIQGTAQTSITHLFAITTDGEPTELTLGGEHFTILEGQTLSCFINIVGRKEAAGDNTHDGSFLWQACIRREGSTTELVGTAQPLNEINPEVWTVSISADDENESLKIAVTGGDYTVRWMATVFASEVLEVSI